jgi:alpha-ribazole phosphatase
MTRLILCRHAQPTNSDQPRLLADALKEIPLAAVYTSPLPRAVDTSKAIADAHQLVPIPVEDLREIDFGEVDGLEFDGFPAELQAALLDDPLHARFPGGETYFELQQRICRAIDRIVAGHHGTTVAAISHAGAIRAALGSWLQIADAAIFRVDQRYGAVNVVDWTGGTPVIRLVNGRGVR